MTKLVPFWVILLHAIISIEGQMISVYSDHNGQGKHVELNISECSNLPDGMTRELTSVDTKGKCARFFDALNCDGLSIEILPHSPSHSNLHSWGFNDRAMSVGPCRDECNEQVTGHEPGKLGEPEDITIFTRKDFKGAYETITVHGCTKIPTKFKHQLLSVKVGAKCLQLYKNLKCDHKGHFLDSIELRQGTPSHHDISAWYMPEVGSVSHCSYKCANKSTNEEKPVNPEMGEIVLFDDKQFEGNWIRIKLSNCINLTDPWEGAAVSVRTYDNTCITLYERRGCTGSSINVEGELRDLSSRNFDSVTRSIRPCDLSSISINNAPHSEKSKSENAPPSSTSSSISPGLIAVIVIVPLLGVLLSVFLVIFIMRRCNPYRKLMEMLSDKEIQEFLNGLGIDLQENSDSPENGDYSAELLAQNKPYNTAYEFPRSNIKFDVKNPLGKGEFGVVYKGTLNVLRDEENQIGEPSLGSQAAKTIPVAIKTVRPDSNIQCLRTLLKEVKVMFYVGKHPNIVQLLGCCTENLRKKAEILVLVEFCPNGSLKDFLQKHRDNFKNYVVKGKIDPKLVIGKEGTDSNMTQHDLEYQNYNAGLSSKFDTFRLLQWSREIARGMEFLAARKVIHSDLAARNILLDENLQAKISDFGLSKQLYCYVEYVKKRQEPLPWRWLALESLKSLEFSTKSDVWAYGILCWEIFSLGDAPYPGIVWSNDFIRNLEDGLRLRKPKYSVTECYNMMLRCWDENPKGRPTFSEIREELEDLLDEREIEYSNISSPLQQTETNSCLTRNTLIYI